MFWHQESYDMTSTDKRSIKDEEMSEVLAFEKICLVA